MRADEVDVRAIHQQVFANVYPWAGNYRVTELRRGEVVFGLAVLRRQSATSAARQRPFVAHIDAPLPRGLREEADDMSFESFLAEYAPTSGPLRLGHWTCTDADRPATRLGP